MNEITRYFASMLKELDAGRDVMAVTVVESLGSAPRGAGARMLVGKDGRFFGTIGGGPVEYLAEQEAARLLDKRISGQRQYDLSNRSGKVDMVCGGTVTVSFHYVPSGEECFRELCSAALGFLKTPCSLWLIMELPAVLPETLDTQPEDGDLARLMGIYKNDEEFFPPSLSCSLKNQCGQGAPGLFSLGDKRYYLEPAATDSLVHIFGGGHVARALAPLLAKTGFSFAVYDDREEFVKPNLFPDAFATRTVSFDNLEGSLFPAKENYFVIMTRGHQCDLQAQAFAMKTPAVYIGVMGSRKKKAALTEKLLEMGFSHKALESVHAPIGLSIGAQTPEEIAVSIAAELIQARSQSGYY